MEDNMKELPYEEHPSQVKMKEWFFDEWTERFTTAIKGGNVSACCMYCCLELDNGLEEIADAMTDLELKIRQKWH